MKPEQQKNLLYILVPSTILIIIWIIFGIYSKAISSTLTENQNLSIVPIAPVFQTKVFSSLEKRKKVDPVFTIDAVPNTIATEEADLETQPTLDEESLTPTPIDLLEQGGQP